jgi:hypothetical protein
MSGAGEGGVCRRENLTYVINCVTCLNLGMPTEQPNNLLVNPEVFYTQWNWGWVGRGYQDQDCSNYEFGTGLKRR